MRGHWHIVVWFFVVGQFGFGFGDSGTNDPGFLAGLISFIVSAVSYIWAVLVAVANYIFAVLQFVWNFLLVLFKDIANAFKWIWENVIKSALTKLVNVFQRVRDWLQRTFAPILHWLKVARQIFDKYFNLYIKPILNLIHHIRQFLVIFRILGFKWAARLDADLALVEQKITKVYTTLRGYLNQVISWINIIADPSGILRRNPLFGAIIRSAKELQNVLDTTTTRPLTGSEQDAADSARTRLTADTQKSNFDNYYSQYKLPPDAEQWRQNTIAQMQAIQQGKAEDANV